VFSSVSKVSIVNNVSIVGNASIVNNFSSESNYFKKHFAMYFKLKTSLQHELFLVIENYTT